MTALAIEKCTRHKVEQCALPDRSGIYHVRVNYWWIVTPEDKVLLYHGVPQASPRRGRGKVR